MLGKSKYNDKNNREKKMITSRKIQITIALLFLLFATIACGTSTTNTGEKVGEVSSMTEQTTAPAVQEVQPTAVPSKSVYTVGDVVKLKDQNVVLNSIDYSNGIIKANFLIENTGSSDVTVSSMLSFSAKSDDGTLLEQNIFDCGTSLDGKVLPGDNLRGDICFKIAAPGLFKVYFQEDLTSSPVVWELDANKLPAAVEQPVSQSTVTTNISKVGDIVKVGDHTITLNSATIVNNLLKANFTVDNSSKEDVIVSSMMSFSAKGPDGTKLEQEIFDCGTAFDGTVIPGDKLRGDICYKTGGASPVKIYYEDNLFSSGAVVWIVE
jgi:hypothetical protein